MSRWLQSVNHLLEKLDGQAEEVAASSDGQAAAIGHLAASAAAGLVPRRHLSSSSLDASSNSDDGDGYDDDDEDDDYEDELVDDDDDDGELADAPRRRAEHDDNNTVSEISFSGHTEEGEGEEDEAAAAAVSPPSPNGSADAPPNQPNRYASRPQQLQDMAKASLVQKQAAAAPPVDPSSNHTQQSSSRGKAKKPQPIPSAPSSTNENIVVVNNNNGQSPKFDQSPRPPRRSLEGRPVLPTAGATLLDDGESSVTKGTNNTNSDEAETTGEANNNAPPRLPFRHPSFPNANNNSKDGTSVPSLPPSANVNVLPTIPGSPPLAFKKGAAPATAPNPKPPPPPLAPAAAPTSNNNNAKFSKELQKLKDKLQAAQAQLSKTSAELKTSQTQVQSLKTQNQTLESKLEAANSEILAQSEELRRAGERMEKDRLRAQEEREDLLDEQDEEMDQLKQTHQKELDGLRSQYEAQIADLTQQLLTEESRRRQEGGDYTQELQDAIERERAALKQLQVVTTERTQFQTTISKLELQQTALQSKLDSALQSVKTAAEREREAEDKLDAAMSLHSRQISQRQAREVELEKTIFELGTALTVARQKQQTSKLLKPKETTSGQDGESFKDKYIAAAEEVETLRVQLNMETQRREFLQQELNDISRERAEEATSAQARQRLHDRKVSDLESAIARLQAIVRDQKNALGNKSNNGESSSEEVNPVVLARELQTAKSEIENLTTQLIRHQNMAETSKSEILALKGRLQAATSRAEQAEQSLQVAQATRSSDAMSNNRLYEMESGGIVGGVRRRVKGGMVGSRNRTRTIRAALQMSPGRTNHPFMEQLAMTLDSLDNWMVETGAFLRHEPLARLAFMLYLVTLHVWSFALVVFHTTEQPHADFGSMDNNPRHWRAAVAAVQQQQQQSSP